MLTAAKEIAVNDLTFVYAFHLENMDMENA